MTGPGMSWLPFYNVSVYTICLLLSVAGIVSTDDLDDFHANITVDERKPGIFYSPQSMETGSYFNNLHLTWNIQTRDPELYGLVLYPTYMDLEQCCDRLILTQLNIHWTVASATDQNATFVPGDVIVYTGPQQTPRDQGTLQQLMQLPTFHSPSGYATMLFHTDSSVAYVGVAMKYFAKTWRIVLPGSDSTIQAFPEMKQLAIQPHMHEFTIEATEGFQIWLQIVYVNSSLTALDMVRGSECKFQSERLEIYDSFCSLDDCLLLAFCRDPYSVTTTTLITYGHSAVVRFMCDRPVWTECALINFRQVRAPDVDSGCPHNPGGYRAIENSWHLEHYIRDSASLSALNMTWWVENTNFIGEMTFSVISNDMFRSQDCLMERLELYGGRCPSESTMITYFCGGVKDTYKLSHSRFAMIRFISHPSTMSYERRPFVIRIQAGRIHITDTPPDGPTDPTNTPSDFPVAVVLVVVGVSILASLVTVCVRYHHVKQSRHRIQVAARAAAEEAVRSTEERKMSQPPIPVAQRSPAMTQPTAPPPMPLQANIYTGTTFDSGGVPGPAIYNPPPLQYHIHPQIHPQPYPSTALAAPLHPPIPPQAPGGYSHPAPLAHAIVTHYPTRT